MPSNLKQLKTRVSEQFRDEFNAIAEKHNLNASKFIADAIAEKIQRDYSETLPGASAPHGVRKDVLPSGWKSRLYRDRYQAVAQWTGTSEGFVFHNYHEFNEDLNDRVFQIVRTEQPEPAEITIIDIPNDHPFSKENVGRELNFAYMEWLSHE